MKATSCGFGVRCGKPRSDTAAGTAGLGCAPCRSPGSTTRSPAPRDYYAKLPPMQERHALVLDPMLATRGSGSAACTYVKQAGPTAIAFVCVVAAPEGVAKVAQDHPDVPIVTAALDRQLNDK